MGGGVIPFRSSTSVGIKLVHLSMLCRRRRRHRLQEEILVRLLALNAEIERPAMDGWQLFSKVTMSRRAGCDPLESGCLPRIALGYTAPGKNTDEEVRQKHQLDGPEYEGGKRDE